MTMMKRMMLVTTLWPLCALQSAGCVVISEEPDSRLLVTWNLVTGDDNAPAACPPGAVTAAVVAEPVGDGDDFIGDGDEIYDLFDCAAGSGRTEPLPSGRYDVWVDIYNRVDQLVAQSGLQGVNLGVGEQRELAYELSIDRGSFGLTWSISDGVRATSCAAVNAGEVQVASTLVGPGGTTYDDFFSCTQGEAVTPGLPLGEYRVGVTLVDGARASLHQPLVIEGSLDFGNAFVDLGSVEFALEE
ncbi:MAG TPA: hypothetical protein VNM90_00075 [Haliangium sp.]|nr:hypothetical protein [Haliangium sp.]